MMRKVDYTKTPDYRDGWVDPNTSAIGGLVGNTFGVNAGDSSGLLGYGPAGAELANMNTILTGTNRVLAPILSAESAGPGQADPIRQTLQQSDPETHKQYQSWWNNHGGDIAAIAAATYFTGGAAGSAIQGSEAAAAAPAAGGAAGAAGGTASLGAAGAAAITPELAYGGAAAGAGAAGSTTGSLVGAGAITPAFASGAYGGAAGAFGSGTLGAAGTAAATNALTPSLASLGTAGAGTSALDKIVNAAKQANKFDKYRSNIMKIANPNQANLEQTKQQQLAQIIMDSNKNRIKPITVKRWTK
jgi:hypothetical protein